MCRARAVLNLRRGRNPVPVLIRILCVDSFAGYLLLYPGPIPLTIFGIRSRGFGVQRAHSTATGLVPSRRRRVGDELIVRHGTQTEFRNDTAISAAPEESDAFFVQYVARSTISAKSLHVINLGSYLLYLPSRDWLALPLLEKSGQSLGCTRRRIISSMAAHHSHHDSGAA